MIDSYDFSFGFTTCKHIQHPKVQLVKLDDGELGVHKVSSRTTRKVVQQLQPPLVNSESLPPPDTAWEAFYPEGSINPSADIPGGFSFYLSGPQEFADKLETDSEVVMSYRMMLQDGWEWEKGGKLPGVCKYYNYSANVISSEITFKLVALANYHIDVPGVERIIVANVLTYDPCGGELSCVLHFLGKDLIEFFPRLGVESKKDLFIPYPALETRPAISDICMFLHSSRSTCLPKIIPQSHKTLLN